MNKETFKKMEREYNLWLQKHPKGDHNYKSFSHMRRSLEFAEHWHNKQVNGASTSKDQALNLADVRLASSGFWAWYAELSIEELECYNGKEVETYLATL